MGKKIIKFSVRPNLKYPFQYLMYNIIREIESILIFKFLDFTDPFIYNIMMFAGEFFSGLIVFLYQKKFVNKTLFKIVSTSKSKDLELITTNTSLKTIDSVPKMIFILFCCALFDFIQLVISIDSVEYVNFDLRLGGFLIIIDALFYKFALKLPILRHQFFCLIAIGICLLIILLTEFIFQEINFLFSYEKVFFFLFVSLFGRFFCAMIDLNEKYLFDYNNVNPFLALLFEGFFGIILTLVFYIVYKIFKGITFKQYKTYEIVILVFALIIYVILSGFKNIYRVNTTKIFTPMDTSSCEYITNPIFIIVDFSLGEDFMAKGERRNYTYFFINLIISLIISFFYLVFNEFIILFFDTHLEISKRSSQEEKLIKLESINDDEE